MRKLTGTIETALSNWTYGVKGRHRFGIVLVALLVFSTISLGHVPSASANDPALTLSSDVVSCTSTITAQGAGFVPGDEVVVSPGGVDDVPGTVFEAYSGPATVAGDGTFAIDIEPGIFIYDCSGGPLGRDGAPYAFTASVVTGVTDPNVGDAFGPPHATAEFSFAVDPDDPSLMLTPDRGSGCVEVTAYGQNFEPDTYVTIQVGQLIGHTFGPAVDDHPLVGADGTFSVTLDPRLTPFIDCDSDRPQVDGARFIVGAITGRGPKPDDDDWRDPQAADVFTIELSAADSFDRTWARTDRPVADGSIARTWMWGPEPITGVLTEPYTESPGGERDVLYYDKSRMEVTHPEGDRSTPWYVTNGLLVVEMIEGLLQSGDDEWQEATPAGIPVAGDLDAAGITYADINSFGLRDAPALEERTLITEVIDSDGNVTNDKEVGDYATFSEYYVPETGHTVASVFWEFMRSQGIVSVDGQTPEAALFENPFYATGLPITEAYWSSVTVDGEPADVLWQCFERRCLTYTPGNPEGWRVESGNVGLHYYHWRYETSEALIPGS